MNGYREWWVKAESWQQELCGNEADPQGIARTLKQLGLLRTREDNNFQIVANIRGRSARVYAISDAILTWRQPVTGPVLQRLRLISTWGRLWHRGASNARGFGGGWVLPELQASHRASLKRVVADLSKSDIDRLKKVRRWPHRC